MTARITRRFVGQAFRDQLINEYSTWQRSGQPLGTHVRQRTSAVTESPWASSLSDLLSGLRREWDDRTHVAGRQDDRHLEQFAIRCAEETDRAHERVRELRDSEAQLGEQREALETIRSATDEHAVELAEQARTEAEQRVALARTRLAEIERLAQQHVEQVEARAQATANAIVAENEARLASREAALYEELERASVAARSAERRAEEARRRAEEADRAKSATADRAMTEPTTEFSPLLGAAREWLVRTVLDERDDEGAEHDGPTETVVSFDRGALEELDRDELYSVARRLDLRGRSSMSKADLIAALEEL